MTRGLSILFHSLFSFSNSWQREGGYQANVQRVLAAEQAILAASENPDALKGHIAALPDAIARKAADHLRLSTAYGPSGGALKIEQFLNSLSEAEFRLVQPIIALGPGRGCCRISTYPAVIGSTFRRGNRCA